MRVLRGAALSILAFLAAATAWSFFGQARPVNPVWTFQYSRHALLAAVGAASLLSFAALAAAIVRRRDDTVSLSVIVAFSASNALEAFARWGGLREAAAFPWRTLLDFHAHSAFAPQAFFFPLGLFWLVLLAARSARAATAVTMGLYACVALIDYGKFTFFQQHFHPSDLVVAAREFREIAVDFALAYLSWRCVLLVALVGLLVFLAGRVTAPSLPRAASLAAALLASGCLAGSSYDFYEQPPAFNYFHNPAGDYYRQGFLTGFVSSFEFATSVPEPEGYSKEAIDRIIAGIPCPAPAARGELPYVIVWQSESFEDLRKYPALKLEGEPYRAFDEVRAESEEGPVLTPQYYTINSQFELASGFFYAHFFPDMVIYNKVRRKLPGALGYALKAAGYQTASLHVYDPSTFNWKVGGESLYGIDGQCPLPANRKLFEGTQRVSDQQYADSAFDCLSAFMQQGRPAAVFVQTDQNHAPHDASKVPEPAGVVAYRQNKPDPELTAYVRGEADTGRTLLDLTRRLASLKKPVVLLFYGDHTASYGYSLDPEWITQSAPLDATLRASSTSFLLWSSDRNQHIAEPPQSLALLGNRLMRRLGAPYSRYQRFLEQFSTQSRGIGRSGLVLDGLGNRSALEDDAPIWRALEAQWLLEYDAMVGVDHAGDRLGTTCAPP